MPFAGADGVVFDSDAFFDFEAVDPFAISGATSVEPAPLSGRPLTLPRSQTAAEPADRPPTALRIAATYCAGSKAFQDEALSS